MRKKSDTVRYTAKQIKAKIARGEDRTDWRKANAVTGKKLEGSIRADVDEVQGEPDWTRAVMGIPAPKDGLRDPVGDEAADLLLRRSHRELCHTCAPDRRCRR